MTIRAVLDEVLANHFSAIAEEMANMVLKSAHTTFVKETQDYAAGLISVDGEVFAYPKTTGVTALLGIPLGAPIDLIDAWNTGDIVIFNDPFQTKGAATHLPDLHLLSPVYYADTLICFTWSFIHSSDVGGSVPGSQDVSNFEIFQEGLRLRPVKLMSGGKLNESIWSIIADNCRIPERNWGDLSAQMAAMRRGALRVSNLADRYGLESVIGCIARVLDQTEARSRQALKSIPPGVHRFVDYLDDDHHGSHPIRIEVCVTTEPDGQITLDFTGSDPQVRGAYNLVTGGNKHHPFVSFAIMNYVATSTEGLHLNAGLLRCIHVHLPEGSILNAQYPAAVAQRFLTAIRVHDVILGALADVDGIELPAAGGGEVGTTMIAVSKSDGSIDVAVANPVQGGAGGGPWHDGDSGSDYPTSFLRNVPAEVLESEMPVIVHGFRQVPDSEGAGRLRGGFAVEYAVELTDPRASLIMRGKERYRFNPWGIQGGRAGTLARTVCMRPDGSKKDLGKQEAYLPKTGEIICIRGAGGGGYGAPATRDPDAVAQDVRDGLISRIRARDIYSVVLTKSGTVDDDATQNLRDGLREPSVVIDFGEAREQWDKQFGDAANRLAQWLFDSVPSHLRYYCQGRAFELLHDSPDRSLHDITDQVNKEAGIECLRSHDFEYSDDPT